MNYIGPVVIGGIGGSGTRVAASILQALNIFIGADVIKTLDNITYTFLFKRPKWFYRNCENKQEIRKGINIMEKSMTNTKPYSFQETMFLANATYGMATQGHNMQKDGTGLWAFQRLNHILFNRKNISDQYSGWGWKEANSHLILKELVAYFPGLKYIHTVRHGLDMAYSNTQQQLFVWGPMFGVPIPDSKDKIPEASFRYWVEVNRNALRMREEFGHERFYLLNFDKLCSNPDVMIPELVRFIGLNPSNKQIDNALNIPKIPETKDRFKLHNISPFRKDDLEFLESLGFEYH